MSTGPRALRVPATPTLNAYQGQVPNQGTGRIYCTTTAGDVFLFSIVGNGGEYDVIIESQPTYRNRPSDFHATHRLPRHDGQLKICFAAGKAPRDLPTAIATAQVWAERTSRYIRDGRPWN